MISVGSEMFDELMRDILLTGDFVVLGFIECSF